MEVRETTSVEASRVLELYSQAFPDEELRLVVYDLLALDSGEYSVAAFKTEVPIAHVPFTICGTDEVNSLGALLAPLGVVPKFKRQAVGSSLVTSLACG